MANPFIPFRAALVNLTSGIVDDQLWQDFFRSLRTDVDAVQQAVSVVLGVNYKTVAQLNALALTVDNTGYTARVTTYEHLVYWTGTAWDWLDGDRPGRFELRAVAPGTGFQLCDGTATTYLAVGATLTEPAFTTPNPSDGTFLKRLAAYTGAIDAAVAPGGSLSGSTAAAGGHDHGGATGSAGTGASGHRHGSITVDDNNDGLRQTVMNFADPDAAHTHTITAVGDHTHGNGTLGVTIDATGTPKSLGALLYFRR